MDNMSVVDEKTMLSYFMTHFRKICDETETYPNGKEVGLAFDGKLVKLVTGSGVTTDESTKLKTLLQKYKFPKTEMDELYGTQKTIQERDVKNDPELSMSGATALSYGRGASGFSDSTAANRSTPFQFSVNSKHQQAFASADVQLVLCHGGLLKHVENSSKSKRGTCGIVCSMNPTMRFDSGIAKVFGDKFEDNYKRISSDTKNQVKVGECFSYNRTRPDKQRLKGFDHCSVIFNVSTPRRVGGQGPDGEKLKDTFLNIFKESQSKPPETGLKVEVVYLPLLGCGGAKGTGGELALALSKAKVEFKRVYGEEAKMPKLVFVGQGVTATDVKACNDFLKTWATSQPRNQEHSAPSSRAVRPISSSRAPSSRAPSRPPVGEAPSANVSGNQIHVLVQNKLQITKRPNGIFDYGKELTQKKEGFFLVNAANHQMQHGGGIAREFSRHLDGDFRNGPFTAQTQKIVGEYKKEAGGHVEAGFCITSDPFGYKTDERLKRLKLQGCQNILNVVAPIYPKEPDKPKKPSSDNQRAMDKYSHDLEEYKKKLDEYNKKKLQALIDYGEKYKEAFVAMFQQAVQHGGHEIVCCFIGCSIFGGNGEVMAEALHEAYRDPVVQRLGNVPKLTLVGVDNPKGNADITEKDQKVYDAFIQKFQQLDARQPVPAALGQASRGTPFSARSGLPVESDVSLDRRRTTQRQKQQAPDAEFVKAARRPLTAASGAISKTKDAQLAPKVQPAKEPKKRDSSPLAPVSSTTQELVSMPSLTKDKYRVVRHPDVKGFVTEWFGESKPFTLFEISSTGTGKVSVKVGKGNAGLSNLDLTDTENISKCGESLASLVNSCPDKAKTILFSFPAPSKELNYRDSELNELIKEMKNSKQFPDREVGIYIVKPPAENEEPGYSDNTYPGNLTIYGDDSLANKPGSSAGNNEPEIYSYQPLYKDKSGAAGDQRLYRYDMSLADSNSSQDSKYGFYSMSGNVNLNPHYAESAGAPRIEYVPRDGDSEEVQAYIKEGIKAGIFEMVQELPENAAEIEDPISKDNLEEIGVGKLISYKVEGEQGIVYVDLDNLVNWYNINNCFICPLTKKPIMGEIKGNQPYGTMTDWTEQDDLAGYEGCGRIRITYQFPAGTQSKEHPNPGKEYSGTTRTAYLPANEEGHKILELLKKAFDQKLTFTIGTSVSTGATGVITWNEIHHKTNPNPNTQFGYPDPEYLGRVRDELAAKGIKE